MVDSMKAALLVLSLIVFLLVSGGFPLLGAEGVFRGGMMVLLLAVLAWQLLVCSLRRRLRLREGGFVLVHLGVCLLLVGAGIGRMWGERLTFGIYLGAEHAQQEVVDVRDSTRRVDLGFRLSAETLTVDHFDPVLTLLKRTVGAEGTEFERIKDYRIEDGKVHLDYDLGTLPVSELKAEDGVWIRHHVLNDLYVLMVNKPADRWISATLRLGSDPQPVTIEVNHPVSHHGWRFYLMSYGEDRQGEYLVLTGRRDPGRSLVIPGIWMLIVGTFWMCLLRSSGGRADDD